MTDSSIGTKTIHTYTSISLHLSSCLLKGDVWKSMDTTVDAAILVPGVCISKAGKCGESILLKFEARVYIYNADTNIFTFSTFSAQLVSSIRLWKWNRWRKREKKKKKKRKEKKKKKKNRRKIRGGGGGGQSILRFNGIITSCAGLCPPVWQDNRRARLMTVQLVPPSVAPTILWCFAWTLLQRALCPQHGCRRWR